MFSFLLNTSGRNIVSYDKCMYVLSETAKLFSKVVAPLYTQVTNICSKLGKEYVKAIY